MADEGLLPDRLPVNDAFDAFLPLFDVYFDVDDKVEEESLRYSEAVEVMLESVMLGGRVVLDADDGGRRGSPARSTRVFLFI